MRIEAGNYVLYSDTFQNNWICEKVISEKNVEYEKRITGYLGDYKNLMMDFAKKYSFGSESKSLEELLQKLVEAESHIQSFVNELFK